MTSLHYRTISSRFSVRRIDGNFHFPISVLFFLITGCFALTAQPFALKLTQFATGKGIVTDIGNAGDSRLFVVQQNGVISILRSDGKYDAKPFLTITDRVGYTADSERGLLGIAFHPQFASNGYFYVDYTNKQGNTHVSRFRVKQDSADVGDPTSEQILLVVNQPFANHNGGQIVFGPDGYLYISLGDGGAGGDPQNNGQNKKALLGKLLRIDVNRTENGKNYAIPPDNPFVNNAEFAPEIWAWGLRNAWRFSFDKQTGDLWMGDVGQDEIEEVNFQPASSKGGENYGWRCYEGSKNFNTNGCAAKTNYVFPVFEYPHNNTTGGCSVTGGFVYRGKVWEKMKGYYFFADLCTGNVWATQRKTDGTFETASFGKLGANYSAFGQNADGELFIAEYGGKISRLTSDSAVSVKEPKPAPEFTAEVFPNPAQKIVNVRLNMPDSFEITLHITDLSGKEISQRTLGLAMGSHTVSVGELPSGSYYLRITAGKQRLVLPFAVAR